MKINFKRSILSLLAVAILLQSFSGVFLLGTQKVEAASSSSGADLSSFIDMGALEKYCKVPEDKSENKYSTYGWNLTCDWSSGMTPEIKKAEYVMFVAVYIHSEDYPNPVYDFTNFSVSSEGCNIVSLGGASWIPKRVFFCIPVVRSTLPSHTTKGTFKISLSHGSNWHIGNITDSNHSNDIRYKFHLRAYPNPPSQVTYPELVALITAKRGEYPSFKTAQLYYYDFKKKMNDEKGVVITEEKEQEFLALAGKFENERGKWQTGGSYCQNQGSLENQDYIGGNLCTRVLTDLSSYFRQIDSGLRAVNAARLIDSTLDGTEAFGDYEGSVNEEAGRAQSGRDTAGGAGADTVSQTETGTCRESAFTSLGDLFGSGGIFTNLACAFLYMILTIKTWLLSWINPGLLRSVFIVENITIQDGFVLAVWETIRTIINIVFIIGFIVMALMNVVSPKSTSWQFKNQIPQIIFAIILVNLSLAIFNAVLLVANQLTGFFLPDEPGQGLNVIFDNIKAGKEGGTNGILGIDSLAGLTVGEALLKTVTSIVFSGILLYLYILLWVRVVILNIIFAFSALPYVARALPIKEIKEPTEKIWSTFTTWVFMAPIAALFVYIAGVAMGRLGSFNTGAGTDVAGQSIVFQSAILGVLMYLAATQPLKAGGKIMEMAKGVLSGKQGIPGTKFNPVKSIKEKAGQATTGIKEKMGARSFRLANMQDKDIEAVKGGALTKGYLKASRGFYQGAFATKRLSGAPAEFAKSAKKERENAEKEYNKKRKKAGWENKLQQPFWEDELNAEKDKIKSIDAGYLMDQIENELLEDDAANPGQKKAKSPDKINKKKVAALMAKIQDVNNGVHGVDAQRKGQVELSRLTAMTDNQFQYNTKVDELDKMTKIIMGGDLAGKFANRSNIGLYGGSNGVAELQADINNLSMSDIGNLPVFSLHGSGLERIKTMASDMDQKMEDYANQVIRKLQERSITVDDKLAEKIEKSINRGSKKDLLDALKSHAPVSLKFSEDERNSLANEIMDDTFKNDHKSFQNIHAVSKRRTRYVEGNQARRLDSYLNNSGFSEDEIIEKMEGEASRIKELLDADNINDAIRLAQDSYKPEFSGRKDITKEELEDHLKATNRILDLRRKMSNTATDPISRKEKAEATKEYNRIKGPKNPKSGGITF